VSLIYLICFLAIYSFVGWVYDSILTSLVKHRLISTGFLNGPFCPIYGFSALTFIIFLTPFKNHPFLIFILSALIVSLFEYLTSSLFETVFKIKLWDYSDLKLNFQNKIALIPSLFWGLLGTIFIYFIHPNVIYLINKVPSLILIIFSLLFLIYLIIDSIYSTISLFGLKKILKEFSKTSVQIQKLSRRHLHFLKSFPNITSKEFDFIKNIYQQFLAKK
jgi:uncharacterized membrane protein